MSNKIEINKNNSKNEEEIKFNLNINEEKDDEIKDLYKVIESLKKELTEKEKEILILKEKLEQETEITKVLKFGVFKKNKEFEILATQLAILKSKYGNKKCDIEVIVISSDDEDDNNNINKNQLKNQDITTSNTITTTTTSSTDDNNNNNNNDNDNIKDQDEVVFCKPYNHNDAAYSGENDGSKNNTKDLGYNENSNNFVGGEGKCNSYVVKKEM
ncbi:hypothetical protein ACTFIU_011354 [Dictyostelium citrinum]